MSQHVSVGIRKPSVDDRVIGDVVGGLVGSQAVLVAHDLNLFSLLAENPRPLPDICQSLGLARRPAEALLAVCASLGLVQLRDGGYSLTPLSEEYLLESSPTYMGRSLDAVIQYRHAYSFDSLKNAILTDAPQIHDGQDWIEMLVQDAGFARDFTRTMHAHSMAPALAWPETIDLSGNRMMLDIGGGSGAHAIGATLAWPHLQAIVFDLPLVCQAAQEYLARYDRSGRIRVQVGDMWNDLFPPADVHFYSDIYHDWPVEKCRVLTEKSFASLPPDGRILIHEMLYNDDKTGPFAVAGAAVEMLLWTEGQQYSGAELSIVLVDAGFVQIEVIPTFGYWSLVTGRKPI